jgi:hypothetical protein
VLIRRRKRPDIVPALGPFNKGFACGPAIFNKKKNIKEEEEYRGAIDRYLRGNADMSL